MDAQHAIRDMLNERGPGKTICPSEAARRLDPENWRDQMEQIRRAAAAMADADEIVVTQKGEAVDLREAKGPVRLSMGKAFH